MGFTFLVYLALATLVYGILSGIPEAAGKSEITSMIFFWTGFQKTEIYDCTIIVPFMDG